jgi:hypothetical protein
VPVKTCIIFLLGDVITPCLPSLASVVLTPNVKDVFLRLSRYFCSEEKDPNVTVSRTASEKVLRHRKDNTVEGCCLTSYVSAKAPDSRPSKTAGGYIFVPDILIQGPVKQQYPIPLLQTF